MSRHSGKMHLNENPATMHQLSNSADLMADDEALRERAHGDGYLWLRNSEPQADVHITAADLAKVMARASWIERDKPQAIAAANLGKRCVEPQSDFHNCLTVHRGLVNEANNMGVSMDARYQPVSAPIAEKYLGVSHQMRDWNDLYSGWPSDEFKYY